MVRQESVQDLLSLALFKKRVHLALRAPHCGRERKIASFGFPEYPNNDKTSGRNRSKPSVASNTVFANESTKTSRTSALMFAFFA
jgi:hypothetical protein